MSIPAAEKAELKKEFDKYDKNRDGVIDWQEVPSAFIMLTILLCVPYC